MKLNNFLHLFKQNIIMDNQEEKQQTSSNDSGLIVSVEKLPTIESRNKGLQSDGGGTGRSDSNDNTSSEE